MTRGLHVRWAVAIVCFLAAAAAPAQMHELILDNTDPEHAFTGDWREIRVVGAHDNNTVHVKAPGDGAWFRFALPAGGAIQAGRYAVYARWVAHPRMAGNTRFEISRVPGISVSVRVDQRRNNAAWVLLGTWDCSGRPAVIVHDDANGMVEADGVKLVRLGDASVALSSSPSTALGDNDTGRE